MLQGFCVMGGVIRSSSIFGRRTKAQDPIVSLMMQIEVI